MPPVGDILAQGGLLTLLLEFVGEEGVCRLVAIYHSCSSVVLPRLRGYRLRREHRRMASNDRSVVVVRTMSTIDGGALRGLMLHRVVHMQYYEESGSSSSDEGQR